MSNARDKANIPSLNFSSTGIDDNATSTAITINSSDNVGIGTSSPAGKLDVAGGVFCDGLESNGSVYIYKDTGDVYLTIAANEDYSAREPSLNLKGYSTSSNPIINFGDNVGYPGAIEYENSDDSMRLYTNTSERMRITSAGNVGIGTSSPSGKLNLSDGTSCQLNINSAAAGATRQVLFSTSTNTQEALISSNNATGELKFESGRSGTTAYFQTFYTNNTERMRITSAGVVGIGAIPPTGTSSSSYSQLEVGNSFVSDSEGTNSSFQLLQNAYVGSGNNNYAVVGSGASHSNRIMMTSGVTSFSRAYPVTADSQITYNESMRIDSSGNVGIGTTAPDAKLSVNGVASFGDGTASAPSITNIGDLDTGMFFPTANQIGFALNGAETVRINANGAMALGTNTIEDKLHVFNGNTGTNTGTGIRLGQGYNSVYSRISSNFGGSMGLYAGTGSANAELSMYVNNILRLRINSSGRQVYNGTAGATGHGNFVGEVGVSYRALAFERTVGGGIVGSVVTNASSTSYNTSSDYRLKENVSYDFNATTRLKQLKPARFNFIADADTTVDGFLAHEVSSIVPEAITGEKDAMKTEEYEVTPAVLDEDGNVITEAVMGTREVPDYQGIDQSKLVPLLVKTIQELEARITALETTTP
jgi:hypothetical protein